MPFTGSAILTLLAVGVHGSGCGSKITLNTIVQVAGVNAAYATCKNLSGQLNQPNSTSGRYAEYLKEQGVKCNSASECFRNCLIDITGNPETGLNDLLGELKSACETYGGTYKEKILPGGQKKRTLSAVGAQGFVCGHLPLVITHVKVAGVKAALVQCSNLPGQFSEPDSNGSRYLEYITEQSATCNLSNTAKDACFRFCYIDLTGNLGNGLKDFLGALKSECDNDGGTYKEKLEVGI